MNIPAQAELERATLVSKWVGIGRAIPIRDALEDACFDRAAQKGETDVHLGAAFEITGVS